MSRSLKNTNSSLNYLLDTPLRARLPEQEGYLPSVKGNAMFGLKVT